MKILFVEASFKSTEPINIMLLSAMAKQRGHQVFVHVLGHGNLREDLKKIDPDLVAYSATTGEHRFCLQANSLVKAYKRNVFTIMGGRHPTFCREVIRDSDLDAICVGEGDDAWPELLEALERSGNISSISNIVTRENFGNYDLRPRISDLDRLPFLDYDLTDQEPLVRNPILGRSKRRAMMTSRGCPYACTYCFNHVYNRIYRGKGPIVSRQTVGRVIAEAKYIKERWLTQFVKFYDDDFVLGLDDWLREFSERWPAEVGLPFHSLLRANVIAKEPEIMALLKKAGMQSVTMSVEAGNDYIRNQLFDRNMSREVIKKAFATAWDLGMYTYSNSLLGVPVTKEEEKKNNLPPAAARDIESLDLNLEIRATMTEYPILFPYPKTTIGEYCRENGFFEGDFDSFTMSFKTQSPMKCFSRREKRVQQNLAILGTVLQAFAGSNHRWIRAMTPTLRFLITKLLIVLPFGKLYLLPYAGAVTYLNRKKLYPRGRLTLWGWLKAIPSSYTFNLNQQFPKVRR